MTTKKVSLIELGHFFKEVVKSGPKIGPDARVVTLSPSATELGVGPQKLSNLIKNCRFGDRKKVQWSENLSLM